jgi:hypothetical protein
MPSRILFRKVALPLQMSFEFLGLTYLKNFDDLAKNIDPAIEKIQSIANFWGRYRLSLPGRINVAKTLMLSQIGFHASIIDVSTNKANEIQQIINNFITGSFKFDKNKICLNPALGGLGMINIKNFITSLHCSWLKRTHREVTDNWRRNLVDIAGGNPILLDPRSLDPDTAQDPDPIPVHPVLYTIAKSFWEFKNSFFAIGRNFFGSHVLGNPRLVNNKLEKTAWM